MTRNKRRAIYLKHPEYFDPAQEADDERGTYAPLVWQCRFSGVEVPDALWTYQLFGAHRKYSDNQAEDMARDGDFMEGFDAWTDRFACFVEAKGKVPAGKYRAYGHKPPAHRWADVKLWWRDRSLRIGRPPSGSSPAEQQAQNLSRDQTLYPARSEIDQRKGD